MAKSIKVWLSRERTGLYMLTYLKPSKHFIGTTTIEEFYVPYGDALGIRHWCPAGIKMFFGVDIALGEQTQVEVDLSRAKLL